METRFFVLIGSGGRYDSETFMQNSTAAPELRSPQSLVRRLRRNAACAEVAVAIALVFSICTLLYAILVDPAALA
jgi:hypothetical protein